MVDIHIHTEFSADSKESPDNYICVAQACGVNAIGFSDHCDYDMFIAGDENSVLDAKKYFEKLNTLENNKCGVKILKGVELGYAPGTERYYENLLADFPFDHVIMSVHGVSGRGDCYYPRFFEGMDKCEAYELYLDAVYKSVASNVDFNILGHLGYIVRYAPYENKALVYSRFSDRIDKILRAVIERGVALEINTSCKASDAVCVTDIGILKRYIELGGSFFSFGSDAHGVDRFADKRIHAESLLKSLGIDYTVHFEQRKIVKDSL